MLLANTKITTAKSYFKGRNLLEIEGMVEYSMEGHPSDIVFLAITKDLSDPQAVDRPTYRMQLHTSDLRNLCEACRELVQTNAESTSYKKMTGKTNGQKFLTLRAKALEDKTYTYYLDVSISGKKISIGFNRYEVRTFIKKIELIAELTERELYAEQHRLSLEAYHNKKRNTGVYNGTT